VGTIYVAGHGGHFVKVALEIDPSATNPITVTNGPGEKLTVSMTKFADGSSTHKLHDARLDGNTLYWSTFNTDEDGKARYGAIDLATGQVTADKQIGIDARALVPAMDRDAEGNAAPGKSPIYCASGQTDRVFMPMTMTNEAYITVIPKLEIK
jgi:hypothetical protein